MLDEGKVIVETLMYFGEEGKDFGVAFGEEPVGHDLVVWYKVQI